MKIKFFFSIAILLFSATTILFAQKNKNKDKDSDKPKEKISLIEDMHTTTTNYSNGTSKTSSHKVYYFKVGDGELKGVGMGGGAMRPFMQSCPAALNELDLCKKNAKTAGWMIAPMLGGVVVAGIGFFHKDDQGELQPLNPITISGGVLFIGSYIAHLVFASKAVNHMKKSVEEYNKSLVAGSLFHRIKPDDWGFYFDRNRVKENTFGLRLCWNINH